MGRTAFPGGGVYVIRFRDLRQSIENILNPVSHRTERQQSVVSKQKDYLLYEAQNFAEAGIALFIHLIPDYITVSFFPQDIFSWAPVINKIAAVTMLFTTSSSSFVLGV